MRGAARVAAVVAIMFFAVSVGAEDQAAKEATGQAGRTAEGKATIKLGDTVYLLAPSAAADQASKDHESGISKGAESGPFKVKGVQGQADGKVVITYDLLTPVRSGEGEGRGKKGEGGREGGREGERKKKGEGDHK